MHNLEPFLYEQQSLSLKAIQEVMEKLDSGELSINDMHNDFNEKDTEISRTISSLAQNGFIEFTTPGEELMLLSPCSVDFKFGPITDITDGRWRLSRFTYSHFVDGEYIIRSPDSDCFIKVRDKEIVALMFELSKPVDVAEMISLAASKVHIPSVFGVLARANIIFPCDVDGNTLDETDEERCQWAFHDLVFHSMSRMGRTEKAIGGTFRFKGILPSPPAVKENPWTKTAIPLPQANLATLAQHDIPLTAAIERRSSIRNHNIVPLTKQQIGEFLFRTVRVRHQYTNELGSFTSRPYPGGGGCYENEFYLTIDACVDIPKGFYYYDPVAHSLCLVSEINQDTEMLLDEAFYATAMQCRPQILVTIANRFNRFNWKYASMSYAAQLKNIGAIYQTMYLVATSMNIAACGLGLGNNNRFERLTGLDYFSEGSVGEFMLGNPA
jgi:SagB-type dehydrogenase family enzyme